METLFVALFLNVRRACCQARKSPLFKGSSQLRSQGSLLPAQRSEDKAGRREPWEQGWVLDSFTDIGETPH